MSSQLIHAVWRVLLRSPIGMIMLTVYFDGIILRRSEVSPMNRRFPGLALLLSLAWGCADSVEIPTVELGGSGGARLMNGHAKSPSEAYDNAFTQLSRGHYNVRRNLETR